MSDNEYPDLPPLQPHQQMNPAAWSLQPTAWICPYHKLRMFEDKCCDDASTLYMLLEHYN